MTGTINTTNATLTRANRIAIQTTDTGYKADFYRTHKHLATLLSEDTTWVADGNANKSAQREDFRKWAIEHADVVGILWNPADLRAEGNVRIAKYETDEMLKEDAVTMLETDVATLISKCPHGVSYIALEAETIVAMHTTAKGYDLSKMGVIDGKYEKTGNWAWADVEMLLTLTKDGEMVYYTTKVQLVSGQLKKPHITQTSFNDNIKESLKEAGVWVEESKEDTKVEDTKVEEVAQEESKVEESTKKTTRKHTNKKSKTETAQA